MATEAASARQSHLGASPGEGLVFQTATRVPGPGCQNFMCFLLKIVYLFDGASVSVCANTRRTLPPVKDATKQRVIHLAGPLHKIVHDNQEVSDVEGSLYGPGPWKNYRMPRLLNAGVDTVRWTYPEQRGSGAETSARGLLRARVVAASTGQALLHDAVAAPGGGRLRCCKRWGGQATRRLPPPARQRKR